MALAKRDPHTGYLTTGHEWNGITELNTPVPRPVYVFLIAAVLFALGYWVLMPAWPLGVTYTKGLLGIDQRASVVQALRQAELDRAAWSQRIAAGSFSDIQADQELMQIVRQTGRTLFGDNCAACHGADAAGGPAFPALTAGSFLWGADPDAIAETVRVGINSGHPDSRSSQMPAFGRERVLARRDIEQVVRYVRSLSAPAVAPGTEAAAIEAGRTIFSANCAACHGEEGTGNTDLGAPDLTDKAWIYGGDAQAVYASVWGGRQGRMPSWEARLSPLQRKILVLYLFDLRTAQPWAR